MPLNAPPGPYPAGAVAHHHRHVPEHTRRVLHEGRVVRAALQVAGPHQGSLAQVAPQQAPLELALPHELLPRPGPGAPGALAAQGHDVDEPGGGQTE